MANPINYSELFDVDGLKAALKELERAEKKFADQASKDLTILKDSAGKLRLEMEKLAQDFEQLNITTKSGQKELYRLTEIADKTMNSFKNQNAAIEANKLLLESLKVKTVEYRQEEERMNAEVVKARTEKKLHQVEAQKLAAQIQALKNKSLEEAAATREAAASMKVASGSYNEANERAKALLKSIKAVEGGFESTNPEILKQIEEYKNLNAQLLKFEQQLGVNYRNVGNYKSAFNGLAFSVTQLTRELPAFGNSLQTGFMGISNNIPIFVDEITKLKKNNEELAASGQKTTSIYKALGSAILSLQTFLSLGVTVLTIYGPKLVELAVSAFKSKEAFNSARESIKLYNQALSSGAFADAVKNLLSLDTVFKQSRKGLIDKKVALDQYNSTIGTVTGKVKSYEEAEKNLVRLGPAFIKMTLNKAAATAALDMAVQDAIKLEELRSEQTRVNQEEEIRRTKYFNQAIENLNQRYRRGGIKSQEEYDRQFNDIIKMKNTKFLTTEQERIQSEINILEKGLEEKLKISQKFADQSAVIAKDNNFTAPDTNTKDVQDRAKLIRAQTALEIAENEKRFQSGKMSELKFMDEKIKITKEGLKKQMDLYSKGSKEYLELEAEYYQTEIDLNKEKQKIIEENIKTETQNELNELDYRYAQGLMSAVEYENKRLEILKNGINSRMALFRKGSKEYLELEGELLKVTTDALNNLTDEELKRDKEDSKNNEKKLKDHIQQELDAIDAVRDEKLKDTTLTEQERIKIERDAIEEKIALLSKYKDAGKDVVDYLKSLNKELVENDKESNEEITERRLATIEKIKQMTLMLLDEISIRQGMEFDSERQHLQEQYEYRKSLAGDNKEALKQIDKDYEKSQRELKKREAIANRNMALFNIFINTAAAVTAALVSIPPNVPLSVSIGIQGAIQAALVGSRPIPQFYKGVQYSPEGPAIVGERGRELIKSPDGKMRLTGDKPELTYLEKGSTVFTAWQTKKMMEQAEILNMTTYGQDLLNNKLSLEFKQNNSGLTKSDMKEVMEESLSKLPINQFIIDEEGYRRRIKKGNTSLNKRGGSNGK